jgi:multiple sugar transport system substrate-binding protein
LPEWADAGWLVPIDQYKTLTAYNADASDFCNSIDDHKAKQYGLTYYTDYMGFIYDSELLHGGHRFAADDTWAEVPTRRGPSNQRSLRMASTRLDGAGDLADQSFSPPWCSRMADVSSMTRRCRDAGGRLLAALRWLVDAVHKHKILSPACVETGELSGLKSFSSGQHAFDLSQISPAHT